MPRPIFSLARRCASWAKPKRQRSTWRLSEHSRFAHPQHLIGHHPADGLPFSAWPPDVKSVHSGRTAKPEVRARIVGGKIAGGSAYGSKLLPLRSYDANPCADAVAVADRARKPYH